ncbi:NIPSNAP family protein [Undibacterium sp.]|uniref:NIPSNAP family protein n=1 Tax=Undibacterium sp. TaxID=1914977 RepID=UPI002CE301B1|nr:NIPSNAP family protein [Undibacterium sp.]HTD06280.1 NIPSNAP family protein [Undibacterium sp.]
MKPTAFSIRLLIAALISSGLCAAARAQPITEKMMDNIQPLPLAPNVNQDYQVVEFRRYTIKSGGREQFARYFESYFPEAFQQLGAIAFGQFFERGHGNGFTWIRGFPSMEARAIANSAFYYGPVWKEHRATLNNLIEDSDNVYLMRPLSAGRGVAVMPAVDPVHEPQGAQGIMVAQLFAVKADHVDSFARQAEEVFARYRAAGIREAGVLVTLDAANNFPQLPVRSDGPYLLWLGLVRDRSMLDNAWSPLAEQALHKLTATGLLTQTPEQIVMDPAQRSRLRWPPN